MAKIRWILGAAACAAYALSLAACAPEHGTQQAATPQLNQPSTPAAAQPDPGPIAATACGLHFTIVSDQVFDNTGTAVAAGTYTIMVGPPQWGQTCSYLVTAGSVCQEPAGCTHNGGW